MLVRNRNDGSRGVLERWLRRRDLHRSANADDDGRRTVRHAVHGGHHGTLTRFNSQQDRSSATLTATVVATVLSLVAARTAERWSLRRDGDRLRASPRYSPSRESCCPTNGDRGLGSAVRRKLASDGARSRRRRAAAGQSEGRAQGWRRLEGCARANRVAFNPRETCVRHRQANRRLAASAPRARLPALAANSCARHASRASGATALAEWNKLARNGRNPGRVAGPHGGRRDGALDRQRDNRGNWRIERSLDEYGARCYAARAETGRRRRRAPNTTGRAGDLGVVLRATSHRQRRARGQNQ